MLRRSRTRRADDDECAPVDGSSRDRAAEPIARAFSGQREQTMAVSSRIHVRVARTGVLAARAWRADEDVGMAVAVDVAGAGDMTAEVVGGAIGLERQQEASVPAGKDERF